MKVVEMVEMYDALVELAGKEMPFAVAMQVATNISKLEIAYKLAMEKKRKMISDAVEKDETGKPVPAGDGSYKLKEENTLEKDLSNLFSESVDIEGLVKIELEKVENLSVKPEILLKVERCFKQEK